MNSRGAMIKLASLFAVVMYGALAWWMTANARLPATPLRPQRLHMLVAVFIVLFVGDVIIAPFISRRARPATAFAVRVSLYGAGALYGLVLFFLTGNPMWTVYFGLPAFLMIAMTPTSAA